MDVKRKYFLLGVILLFILSGCSAGKNSDSTENKKFDEEMLFKLKQKAKVYSEAEFQNGDVPQNEYVQLSGEIVKAENGKKISENERFILKSGSSSYQIFNEQGKSIKVSDKITVYGEYYGFIKGMLIEKNN